MGEGHQAFRTLVHYARSGWPDLDVRRNRFGTRITSLDPKAAESQSLGYKGVQSSFRDVSAPAEGADASETECWWKIPQSTHRTARIAGYVLAYKCPVRVALHESLCT